MCLFFQGIVIVVVDHQGIIEVVDVEAGQGAEIRGKEILHI